MSFVVAEEMQECCLFCFIVAPLFSERFPLNASIVALVSSLLVKETPNPYNVSEIPDPYIAAEHKRGEP